MGLYFNFSGINKRLEEMDKKAANIIIDEALEEASKPIIRSIKKNVPKDTRALEEAIGIYKKKNDGLGRSIQIAPVSTDRTVMDRAYYTNYGTRYMVGQNWRKKAINESKEEAIEAARKVVFKRLKE